jgi:hypothetical protein
LMTHLFTLSYISKKRIQVILLLLYENTL